MTMRFTMTAALLAAAMPCLTAAKKTKVVGTPLDQYVREAQARAGGAGRMPGAIWSSTAPMADLGRDPRARFVDDTITVLVVERASASAGGSVKTQRKSSLKASVNALGGATRALGPWAKLADVGSESSLDGQGATTRETTASTTLTGRVAAVLPNGNMVVEATKETLVNSERQLVTVRGIARPFDVTAGNVVRSDRLAQLEVRISGKGVVSDATRRPFILYRLLMGLLPF